MKQQAAVATVLISVCLALVPLATGAVIAPNYGPETSLITGLPGLDVPMPSQHYGGYINVPGTEKQYYYYFATSERDPANDPVVLWLNGGPGCSSLIGWGQELGPFKLELVWNGEEGQTLMNDGVHLTPNPYAWNKVANMLFIEQPASVGFSFSPNAEVDYTTNDTLVAQDLAGAIREWFTMYPFFQSHSFYASGESYAGVYVPMLVTELINGNMDGVKPYVDMQGYLVGNPVGDEATVDANYFELFGGFYLIPPELMHKASAANCDSFANPIGYNETSYTYQYNEDFCVDATEQLDVASGDNTAIFFYDIISPCFYGLGVYENMLWNTTRDLLLAQGKDFVDADASYEYLQEDIAYNNGCGSDDRPLLWFFNQANVREAMHAEPLESDVGFWFECNPGFLNYTSNIPSTVPNHLYNIEHGVRALVYEGDHDLVCPFPGVYHYVTFIGNQLGDTITPWSPWWVPDPANFGSQIAGYMIEYNGLTFMTFRNAGHEVPWYKPLEALTMFDRFLGNSLNDTLAVPEPSIFDSQLELGGPKLKRARNVHVAYDWEVEKHRPEWLRK